MSTPRRVHHVNCRLLGHAWDYTTVLKDGPHYVQGLRCMRCGTERRVKIHSRTGESKGNSYTYAPDYRVPGGLSPDDRARLRLATFRERFRAEAQALAEEP